MGESVCISDANIWIDLANGDFLVEVFQLPFSFCSTDFVLQELDELTLSKLKSLGLVVRELSEGEVQELYVMLATLAHISLEDASCFFVARIDSSILLTGDRRLRAFASADSVEVHGVLWLLDQLVARAVITPVKAADGLQAMLDKNARLPKAECDQRLAAWRAAAAN